MNILLIGYCHLQDGFLYASQALERLSYNIHFFPFLSYKMDNNDNLIKDFHNLIKEKNINICLWWNNSIPFDEFTLLYISKITHIYFNWDPVLYNSDLASWSSLINNKNKIYPYMNIIFTCFGKEIEVFHNYPIYYNPPGFDKHISFFEFDQNYSCDVSIVLTNLYDDENVFPSNTTNITRTKVVNYLYSKRKLIKFHIYGPEKFKEAYPECYQRFISYNECNKIFSNSKINLSIHPIVNELHSIDCEKEYFSERVPQILGCKGLLLTNSNLHHCLKPNKDYIYIDHENYQEKIMNVIENSNLYDKIRMNGYEKGLLYYQWNNWATKIHNMID